MPSVHSIILHLAASQQNFYRKITLRQYRETLRHCGNVSDSPAVILAGDPKPPLSRIAVIARKAPAAGNV